MTQPTNAEIEHAARVLVRAHEGSTTPAPAVLRALVAACDERNQERTVANVLRCRIDDAVSWLDEPDDASTAVQLAKIEAALRGPR